MLSFSGLFLSKKHQGKSGFTLPELLIVMAVLGGLAALMMSTYPASQKKARDTRRRSDIKQYQTAMEIYYNRQSRYLVASGNLVSTCGTLGLSGCPDDPNNTSHYQVSSNATQYVLGASLERPADDALPYFIVCSNGKSGEHASFSGPACPLP